MGLNVLLYIPVGLFGFLAFSDRYRSGVAILIASLIGFGASTVVELAQQYDQLRSSSVLDVLSNSAGSFLGAVLGWFVLHRKLASWAEQWILRADALFLTFGWIAWQVFPATPFLTRTGDLIVKFRLSDRPRTLAGLDILLCLTETLALAKVMEVLNGGPLYRSRRGSLGFAALLLLVPLKAVIWGRGVSAVEIVTVGVAWLICVVVPRVPAVPLLLGVAIVIDGLAPFRFDSVTHAFSMVPFLGSLESDWFSGIPVLLGKAFRYAALVWMLREAKWPWWAAGGLTAAFLGILELIQMRLPGRSPEITDPLLALLAMFVFWAARDAFEALPHAPQVR